MIDAVQLTLDVHVSEASPRGIPLDAHASPLALPPVAALRLWAWPSTMVRQRAACHARRRSCGRGTHSSIPVPVPPASAQRF